MRLLPVRADHAGGVAARQEQQSDQGRVVAHNGRQLCRCMTYSRIQKAIMRAASEMRTASPRQIGEQHELRTLKSHRASPLISAAARSSSVPPPRVLRSAIPQFPACSAPTRRSPQPAISIPAFWYSIAPDGIVTVTCGKADMGQHIASTMAQIVSEELGSNWKDMRIQLASNDPKFNDPVLRRADYRRQLEHDDELRCNSRAVPRGASH